MTTKTDRSVSFSQHPVSLAGTDATAHVSTLRVLAFGAVWAVVIAVSIAAQTYLSMLGHGHSFWRILG